MLIVPSVDNVNFLMNIKFDISLTRSILFHRWALYPPGRVPGGVTVHVNDEDGDVDIETPTSLQVIFLKLNFSQKFLFFFPEHLRFMR